MMCRGNNLHDCMPTFEKFCGEKGGDVPGTNDGNVHGVNLQKNVVNW